VVSQLIRRVFVAGLGELVFEPRFFGREGEALDGDVVFAETLDDVFVVSDAAFVVGLAYEDDDAAAVGWLLVEEIDAVADGVEDGGAAVAGVGLGEAVFEVGDVGGEVPEVFGLAVEGDHRDLIRRVGGEVGEHGAELDVVGELARGGCAGLHEDDDGERLVFGVFEGDGLGSAVVCEEEIGGVEGLEEVAFWSADEGGDNDEVGGGGDGLLRMEGGG